MIPLRPGLPCLCNGLIFDEDEFFMTRIEGISLVEVIVRMSLLESVAGIGRALLFTIFAHDLFDKAILFHAA